jgi:hypothetical protein
LNYSAFPLGLCQAAFEAEKKDRLEREAKIQDNLSKHEHETFQRFEVERVRHPNAVTVLHGMSRAIAVVLCVCAGRQDTREKTHKAIKDRLDVAIASRTKADEKFQAFVASEIADIKNCIRREEEVW